jgi:ubiquitin C-terminal hydrolase
VQSIDEGKVKKQIKLDSLPEILIVQLARFSFDYYKGIPIKVRSRSFFFPGTTSLRFRYACIKT